jgi:hypothetical protein
MQGVPPALTDRGVRNAFNTPDNGVAQLQQTRSSVTTAGWALGEIHVRYTEMAGITES